MIQRSQIQICFESLYTLAGRAPFQGIPKATYEKTPLTNATVTRMASYLNGEIQEYYYKALLSYAESISAICNNHFSWATVKLYYSTFYALRAFLACNDYVFLRAGEKRNYLYYTKLKSGETLTKMDSSDHKSTIALQKTKFPNEWLLSQTISEGSEDITSYEWLAKRREDVNYKDVKFRDPIPSEMWEYLKADIDTHSISNVINQLIEDLGTLCFQQEYAVLAIPTKRLYLTAKELHNRGIYFEDEMKREFLINTASSLELQVWQKLLDICK